MGDRRHNLLKPSALIGSDADPPAAWVWNGYLAPGAVTVLSAGFKIGKSTLLTLLLNEMRDGGTLAGEPVAKGRALVASEEPKRVWRPRLKKFDLEGHVEVDIRPFPVPPPQADWKAYAQSYEDVPADLVVFDSLMHFLPPHTEGNLTLMREGLAPLRRIADLGRAVLVLHQPSKANRGEFNFRGHGTIDGDPEVLMEMKLPRGATADDRRRILQVRSRLDYSPPRRLLQLDAGGRMLTVVPEPRAEDAYETGWLALKVVLEDATERLTTACILKDWLPDYWKPSLQTLRRWLERAGDEKKIERFGKGRCSSPFRYALPGKTFDKFGRREMPDFNEMDRERWG